MSDFPSTPSDICGALQRGLSEVHAYLGNNAMQISAELVRDHLERMIRMVDVLGAMQNEIMAHHAANGQAGEARVAE